MWPTEITPLLLLLGLSPLAYVILSLVRNGIREAASLRFLGIVFLWVGFQLSPWLAYLDGSSWPSLLLVPEYLDSGLIFSTLSMWAMVVGYRTAIRRGGELRRGEGAPGVSIPSVNVALLVAVAAVSLVLFVVNVGGPSEVLVSAQARGAGQWDERDAVAKIRQMLAVVGSVSDIVLAVTASLYIAYNRLHGRQCVLGWLGLIIASLYGTWFLSRIAGFPFIVNTITIVRLVPQRQALFLATLSLGVGLAMGMVGFFGRGSDNPGLATFVQAAVSPSVAIGEIELDSLSTVAALNPMDAMASWTARAESAEWDTAVRRQERLPAFLWNLHPFPSEVVPIITFATDLAEIKGTVNSAGLPTPAFGELYYVFGLGGAMASFVIGFVYGWADRRVTLRPSFASLVAWVLFVSSIAVGLHSGVRAMTRPILYGVALYFILTQVVRPQRIVQMSRGCAPSACRGNA